MHYFSPISILPHCALLFPLVSHPVKQDADGGSLQDKAQILWRLKAEGVVGFYGQKSPLDKGTSASTRRSIAACMVRAAGVCGMISTFFCTLTTHQGA